MADGYQLAPGALDGLIQVLDDAAGYVRAANAELSGFGGGEVPEEFGEFLAAAEDAEQARTDLLGNETLAGAAADFADTWSYGLEKLDEAATEVIEQLEASRQTYDDLEQRESNVFSGIDEALNGGGSW
jgi:hypothetical protein